jgi:hypothetical protein
LVYIVCCDGHFFIYSFLTSSPTYRYTLSCNMTCGSCAKIENRSQSFLYPQYEQVPEVKKGSVLVHTQTHTSDKKINYDMHSFKTAIFVPYKKCHGRVKDVIHHRKICSQQIDNVAIYLLTICFLSS